ncbi:peroxidase-like [Myzus persicae]|uniref:peroxidase-like n=1 Tax=Myzus persicae TaxID=13164 RepID=UPI000B92FC40|nr:peroxidase-like [Myzus persicae]
MTNVHNSTIVPFQGLVGLIVDSSPGARFIKIIRMSTLIMIIRLLICSVIFVPPYCRGFKDGHILDFYEQGLVINSKNWYLKLNVSEVNEEIQKVTERIENRYRLEDIISNISHIEIRSPAHGQLIDSMPSKDGNSASRFAEIIVDVTRSLKNTYCLKYGLSDIQCAKDLTKVNLTGTTLGEMCMSEYYNNIPCKGQNFDYHSADGSCNNLKRKNLGKANTPYKRLLFPVYTDGVSEMPNIYEQRLPNPRLLSTNLVKYGNSTDPIKSMMMPYWAIFIGHDLSHTAFSTMGKENKFVNCCHKDKSIQYTMNKNVRSCKPIPIPYDDKFFKPEPHDCMNYVRSRPAVRSDCTFGPMEQMNQATHFLDASMVYGTTESRTLSLRDMSSGRFIVKEPGMPVTRHLPYEYHDEYAYQNGTGTCYLAGDIRANSYPPLMALHTLWTLQHNKFVDELRNEKPDWTDEQLFREGRKIVTACIQHITYNEWLPALLGVNYTEENGLGLEQRTVYDETADPTVSNSFATAILPFANSMIREEINKDDESNEDFKMLSLKKYYNQPLKMHLEMGYLLTGITRQNTQKVDMFYAETITNYLYSISKNTSFGMDILSLDIQRSRDHGIPSYTQFRKYCGLKGIENVQDLSEIMKEGSADILLKQYKTWNDIDLLVGVLLEKHADDAMVGPTMRCIIKEQFVRTRIADRHFYDLPGVFSEYQLDLIKQLTLARVICDVNYYGEMQRNAFLKPSANEPILDCLNLSIPKMSLSNWFDTFQYSDDISQSY